MPALPRHSSVRARVAALATGPSRFESRAVPSLDASTDAALERLRAAARVASEHGSIHVSATPFVHGCSVAIVSLPPEPLERPERLEPPRWPGKADLLRRLAAFGACEPIR